MKDKRKQHERLKAQRAKAEVSTVPSPLASHRSPDLEVYDTTLRDGAQAEDVSFSAEDKVRVAHKLPPALPDHAGGRAAGRR